MPGFDGTGPLGMGPMSGRGLGFCNPYGRRFVWRNNPWGFRGFGFRGRFGRGFGRGLGRGFGWRGRFWGGGLFPHFPANFEMSKDEELNLLREEAQYLKEALEEINKRVSELEAER